MWQACRPASQAGPHRKICCFLPRTCSRSASASCCAASTCSSDALLVRLAAALADLPPTGARASGTLPTGAARGAVGAGPRRTAGIVAPPRAPAPVSPSENWDHRDRVYAGSESPVQVRGPAFSCAAHPPTQSITQCIPHVPSSSRRSCRPGALQWHRTQSPGLRSPRPSSP